MSPTRTPGHTTPYGPEAGPEFEQFVRAGREGWFQRGIMQHGYDIVQEPVLKNLTGFMKAEPPTVFPDYYQISWHTQEGADILNRAVQK